MWGLHRIRASLEASITWITLFRRSAPSGDSIDAFIVKGYSSSINAFISIAAGTLRTLVSAAPNGVEQFSCYQTCVIAGSERFALMTARGGPN